MQHDAHVQTRCRGGKAVESLKANLGFHVDLATGSVMTGADDVGPESRKKKGREGGASGKLEKKGRWSLMLLPSDSTKGRRPEGLLRRETVMRSGDIDALAKTIIAVQYDSCASFGAWRCQSIYIYRGATLPSPDSYPTLPSSTSMT